MKTKALGPGRDGKDTDKTGGTVIEVINGDFPYHELRHVIRYIKKSSITVCLQ